MPQPDPADFQPRELLQIAADFFEARGVAYRIVGSMASIAYGENRFTNDVDIVADLLLRDIGGILKVKAGAVDRAYIAEWAAKLGVGEEWELVRRRVDGASR